MNSDNRVQTKIAPAEVKTVGVVGLGTIGMSWAAYFLARGLNVRASDPDPGAKNRTTAFLKRAWLQLEQLGLIVGAADTTNLVFVQTSSETARGADFVQENGPEDLRLKRDLITELDAELPPGVVLASSTSALSPTALQQNCTVPGRVIIAHPFNPPHLVPLVELCGGEQTDKQALVWAREFFAYLRRKPVVLSRETYGHVANRLQYVLYNEAVKLVLSGVVSLQDLETVVTYGPGLRWPFLGPFLTHHIAGGPDGIRGAFAKFEERERQSTDRVVRVALSGDQKEYIIAAIHDLCGDTSIAELEAQRDAGLIGLLGLLRDLGRLQ